MKAHFQISKTSNGKFMFDLKAANDQTIFTSQMYESKEGAEEGIHSVKQNASIDARYQRKVGTDGKPYFVLHAANKLVIGRSQMYSSNEAMEKGVASVKHNALEAEIVDLSVHAKA